MGFSRLAFTCAAALALMPVAGCASETEPTEATDSTEAADSLGDTILCHIFNCEDWGNSERWIKVGETPVIDGFFPEHHSLDIDRGVGRVSRMQLRVREGGVDIRDFEVYFRDGSSFSPDFAHQYDEGERTPIVSFPRPQRIEEVSVRASKELFGSGAVIEIWVRR